MIWTGVAAFLTGILASMGVGGGMVLIIYLTVISGMPQLEAQGINLVYFIPIALFSVIIHSKNKLIEWKKILAALIPGAVFAVAGAYAAEYLGSDIMGRIFGGFILLVGVRELFSGRTDMKKYRNKYAGK